MKHPWLDAIMPGIGMGRPKDQASESLLYCQPAIACLESFTIFSPYKFVDMPRVLLLLDDRVEGRAIREVVEVDMIDGCWLE